MPRRMPNLVGDLQRSFGEARGFVATIERIRSLQAGRVKPLTVNRARFAYEAAYLRAFAAWENFLEESFLRYLAGYSSSAGPETIVAPYAYAASLHDAETVVLNGKKYLLWHNPAEVVARAQRYFKLGRHEQTLDSVLSRVKSFATIRHHVAHQRAGTAHDFDQACIHLCGFRCPGSRVGTFLRKFVPHVTPAKRWFDLVLTDLESYAAQIVP